MDTHAAPEENPPQPAFHFALRATGISWLSFRYQLSVLSTSEIGVGIIYISYRYICIYIYIGYRYRYLLRVSAVSVFAWAPPFIVRRYDRGTNRRTRTPYVTVCSTTELPIGGQRNISTIRSLDEHRPLDEHLVWYFRCI